MIPAHRCGMNSPLLKLCRLPRHMGSPYHVRVALLRKACPKLARATGPMKDYGRERRSVWNSFFGCELYLHELLSKLVWKDHDNLVRTSIFIIRAGNEPFQRLRQSWKECLSVANLEHTFRRCLPPSSNSRDTRLAGPKEKEDADCQNEPPYKTNHLIQQIIFDDVCIIVVIVSWF